MSRIVLSKYDTGQDRIVVGWDHPAQGCFWQEFNLEPKDWSDVPEDWREVLRHGGVVPKEFKPPGIPLDDFRESVPNDIRPLITDEVYMLLYKAAEDPESGRWQSIDMSGK